MPSLTVHTRDEHPGAEPVDVIATTLLRQGFDLLTAPDLDALLDLPVLAEWAAELDTTGRHLHVTDPTGSLYDGELGAAVPPAGGQIVAELAELTMKLLAHSTNVPTLATAIAARRTPGVV